MSTFKINLTAYFILFCCSNVLGNGTFCPADSLSKQINIERNIKFNNNIEYAKIVINQLIESYDTACVIKVCQYYVRYDKHKNYSIIFTTLWEALLLADEANLKKEKYDLHLDIARYYSYLQKFDKAKEHFDASSKLKKTLIATNNITNEMQNNFYAHQMHMYNIMKRFDLAKIYLDSCYQLVDSTNIKWRHYTLDFEKGLHLAREHQYEKALAIFNFVIEGTKSEQPGYLTIPYYHSAKAYYALGQIEESLESYHKSIEASLQNKMHLDFLPMVYFDLSMLYNEIGNHKAAFKQLIESKNLNFQFFDIRSDGNSYLLNVQDDFRVYKEKQEKIARRRELNDVKISRILLVGSLLLFSIFTFVYFRLQKGKIQAEKALNQQLKIQNIEKERFLKRIEKKNEELMTFSNIMSHDLKAPVKNIAAFSHLIKKQFQNGFNKDKVIKFNDFIDSSAKSMSILIEDLLLYSRINLADQEFSKVDLNEVIDSVYPAFSYDVNTGYANLNIEKLPTIWGNNGLLKTVFHNLISNSIKYQPKGDADHKAKVNIWSVKEENEHFIFVKDNGIGIKPEFAGKLFKAFSRYHKSSDYSGTGLGMSICKRIMNTHGGSIQLEKTDSTGSTFKLMFPIAKNTKEQPVVFQMS